MLEARDVSFSWGTKQVLSQVSIRVSPDERLEVNAPSGTGKTTLCKLLAGYLTPQQGQVLVDGEALPSRGKCPVQLIQQHPELAVDPRMRMRAVLAESGADSEELERLCESFGIQAEWTGRYPHELSGGELQRFCIVRALAAEPKYLICDEISTMLDALTQMQIWKAILAWAEAKHMGLVFVSHSPSLASRIRTNQDQDLG